MAIDDGGSRAPYVIICNGRIDLLTAQTPRDRVKAASHAARDLVMYYGDSLTEKDTAPISTLQHAMMDALEANETRKAEEMVDEMFTLLDGLEKSYG